MNASKKIYNTLFWRIAGTLLLLLILLGVGYTLMTSYYANRYFQETTQRLNKDLAQYTVDHVETFVDDTVNTKAIQDIMHSMMIINPSVEVYLLDTKGKILTFVAPYKKIKMESVDLAPVRTFIAGLGEDHPPFIMGDDPRDPGGQKVFSAAPIKVDEQLKGYYYVVLAGEKQGSVTSTLVGSYFLRVGARAFFLTLFAALVVGLLAVWFLTQNLRTIVETVRRFKEGDYQARIENKGKGELTVLSDTFNDMADTIVRNIDDLKAVENLRRELTANVSHDLRTPLAIMQGYVETLMIKKDTISNEDREKYLKIILSSTEKMGKLIKQLFEYSKLEAQQVKPEKEPFFITELAQDVIHKYEILAGDKGISMELKRPDELPLVFADVALVERVLQNLIDNAIKFTPQGGKVSLELSAKEDREIEIKVSDTGPGMSEQEQSYIFERYHRLKTGEAKSNGSGAGLGLAIVKKILEIHNATIQVISQPNQGASFMFQLPVYQQ
ncbi:MAG: HAMP domain-containing sensor histidine kinase [Bacteroidota bacterium]